MLGHSIMVFDNMIPKDFTTPLHPSMTKRMKYGDTGRNPFETRFPKEFPNSWPLAIYRDALKLIVLLLPAKWAMNHVDLLIATSLCH